MAFAYGNGQILGHAIGNIVEGDAVEVSLDENGLIRTISIGSGGAGGGGSGAGGAAYVSIEELENNAKERAEKYFNNMNKSVIISDDIKDKQVKVLDEPL